MRAKRIVFVCMMISIPLCFLEIGFRLLGYCEYKDRPFSYWVPDQYLGFRNRANLKVRNWDIAGTPAITTDGNGYRNGMGWPGDSSQPLVIFVGDSMTFGAEVDDDETIPSETARLMARRQTIRVLNAGVRAYSRLQSKRILNPVLDRFTNIAVVVYVYCWNDYFENLNSVTYHWQRPPVLRLEANGRFSEVDPPAGEIAGLIPARNQNSNRALLTLLAWSHSAALHNVAMWGYNLWARKARVVLPDGSASILNPTESEVDAQKHWAKENGADAAMVWVMSEMDRMSKQVGAAFIGVSSDLEDETDFNRWCQQAQVQCIGVRQAFAHDLGRYFARERNGGRLDGHFNSAGTETFARAITPAILGALGRSISTVDLSK
jgi:hypothetical protein